MHRAAGLVRRSLYIAAASNGVSTIRIANSPVNVLNRPTLASLCADLAAAQSDSLCTAVVLTGEGRVFSAGLDIAEFYGQSEDSVRAYLASVRAVFNALYPFKKPVVAAVNGAAPAGGCWLALLSDYRVLSSAPTAVIGLNEVGLGVVAPPMLREPLVQAAGYRAAERMLQLGLLLAPQDALACGVVDELAEPSDVLVRAHSVAAQWAAAPAFARAQTKAELRAPLVAALAAAAAADDAGFLANLADPGAQETIGRYLASLKKRKA